VAYYLRPRFWHGLERSPFELEETPPSVSSRHNFVVRAARSLLRQIPVRSGLLLALTWTCVAWNCAAAIEVQAELGWQGAVRLGRWNVASTVVQVDAPATLTLECLALDSEGHTAKFRGTPQSLPAGTHRLAVPFQLGRPDATIRLQILTGDDVLWSDAFRSGFDNGYAPLVLSDRLVVTTGLPRGFERLEKPCGRPAEAGVHVVELNSAAELPAAAASYAGVDWLVLAGTASPSPEALTALRDWIQEGGRLLVSLPAKKTDWQSTPLRPWLPIPIAEEPVVARELGQLEFFAGRNLRIPYAGRLEIPKLGATDGSVLASSLEETLLVRIPWGLGEVLVLALDLTQPPLANWGALPEFVQKFVSLDERTADAESAAKPDSIGPLTSSGITDLASQVQASQDHFALVERPAPWWVMAWMLGLVVLIGPLDYLLVHKLLRRPSWTWATLPIWLCGLAAYAASTSDSWNTAALQINQVSVIDVDAVTAHARAKSWTTIYSPRTARFQCQIAPATQDWSAIWSQTTNGSELLGWFYVPETTTGGLYRPGGGEWGRTTYVVSPAEGQVTELPVLQWSSRTLTSGWSGSAKQVVESNLRNTGLGRLSGEVVHHLPGRLTDWMLAYGGRYYRLQPSRGDGRAVPLEPGARLTTEDPLLLQGDLRTLLAQIVYSREVSGARSTDQRVVQEQTPYDATERDPLRLWQVLSFHRKAGGRDYTGLSNDWLLNDDCSRQLDLGRAVLFGRLDVASRADVEIDGVAVQPQRQDVFVRIVLPVRRSGEVIRTLPKFGSDDDRR